MHMNRNRGQMWKMAVLALGLLLAALGGGIGRAAETPAPAALRLPAILSDNMVLQADKPVRIWGWAPPGQAVTVKVGGQEKAATAGADGKWQITLAPLKAGGGPLEMTVAGGGATLTVKNILAGEVWLCSGQSNMAVPLWEAANGAAEIRAATYPKLRLFLTRFHAPDQPADDLQGKWVECSPATAGGFSAVAYLFGRELHQALKVPVGLIQSAHGATAIENWISLAALQAEPSLKSIVERHAEMPKDSKGWDPQLPTGLYNGEIAPLTPFALRGVIWYQGESNASRAAQYRTLFPVLIRGWRQAWGEELPFYFVQLANLGPAPAQPGESDWAELREAQALALALPHIGMAVAVDIGEAGNIHPKNKQEVARRLALWALDRTYGQKRVYSGPLYQAATVEGGKIRVRFNQVGGGLAAKGGPLKRFAIAGSDRKFVWADAVIDGDSVVVASPAVSQPVAVRYAWANNPEGCNLYNQEGLPAAPFRTDTWPGITAGATGPKPTGKRWTPPPPVVVAPAAQFTGNTLEVALGKSVARSWDDVRATDYVYAPKQEFLPAPRETHLWLPYGNARGLYHEAVGLELTDPEPGAPPAMVSRAAPAHLTLKFHFDRPIASFRFAAGPAEFRPTDAAAVAGVEYSTDGKSWTTLREVSGGGNNLELSSAKQKTTGLKTQDLYLRIYTRDKANPGSAKADGARLKVRMGGDVAWGDASYTFFQAQWQLWVTPAE
ncbi:MAG: sialate O-acetylesterase [Lentisphaeria bacterium]|jgi:sialate O-acetylesterase